MSTQKSSKLWRLRDISNAGVAHEASGGHIRGAGSATSDSIPAMVSNGEYVVRASAVDHLAVVPQMAILNIHRDLHILTTKHPDLAL